MTDTYLVIILPLVVAVACLAWGIYMSQRASKLERAISALLGAEDQIVLFYDERNRLVFSTKGLVFFDRRATRTIRNLPNPPQAGREDRGEMEIDGNRYRYRTKSLEYKPETCGTAVYLEYLGPLPAKK